MAFVKNIVINTKKSTTPPAPLTMTVSATATGSAGYFTSSGDKLYSGATLITPINITFSSSIQGGVSPFTITWFSSAGLYPSEYASGSNTGSFTGTFYSLSSSNWTATVTDSDTPPISVSASIQSIIYGNGADLWVATTGSDTQSYSIGQIPGDQSNPLKTINTGILYAVPSETIIYVVSGTYTENPRLNKNIFKISGSGESTTYLSSSNYFIYDSKSLPTQSIRNNVITGINSSSFSTIGVTPNGYIQTAINDGFSISSVSGSSVYCLPGVHEITDTLIIASASNPNFNRIYGDPILTGSAYAFPTGSSTILRLAASKSIMLNFYGTHTKSINDVALEIYHTANSPVDYTSDPRFGAILTTGNVHLNKVLCYLITGSVPRHLQSFASFETSGRGSTNIEEWPLNRYFNDVSDAGGVGVFNFTAYSPINRRAFLYGWFANGTAGGVDNTTIIQMYDWLSPSTANRMGTGVVSTRPTYRFNRENVLNRSSHIWFPGRRYMAKSFTDGASAKECLYVWVAFQATSSTLTAPSPQIIVKNGNSLSGFSFAIITGSKFAMTFYTNNGTAGSTDPTSSVWLTASISANTPYIAELYFNGNSTAERVKMALYDSSSAVEYLNFSTNSFSMSRLSYGTATTGHAAYVAAGTDFRVIDFKKTSSITNIYTGSLGGWLYTYNPIFTESFNRKPVFDWFKLRYFPSGSTVTHSLS